MNKLLPLLTIVILAGSCCKKYSPEIQQALVASQDNRSEIESVLEHYRNTSNPQKLKAAEFLITNMPGHYSYKGELYESYKNELSGLYPDMKFYILHYFDNQYLSFYTRTLQLEKIEDIKTLSAEYIIQHIDNKFKLKEVVPWGKDISFENFCEYVLPYRQNKESIDISDNNSLSVYINKIQEAVKYPIYSNYSILSHRGTIINKVFASDQYYYTETFQLPAPIGFYKKDCIYTAYITQARLNLLCIPTTLDFAYWPDQNGSHYWNSILDPEMDHLTLNEINTKHAAKVYRMSFSHNPYPNDKINDVPAFFQSPFIKDVTELYSKNVSISCNLHILDKQKPQYAYLCVFNESQWIPIAWGEIKNKNATFNKMGVNSLYLPIYYHNKNEIIAGYPFHLTAQKTKTNYIPQKNKLISVKLKRKYPLNANKLSWAESLVGMKLEGSNRPDFKDAETIDSIIAPLYEPFYELKNSTRKKYRYWRVKTDKNTNEIAELSFYNQNDTVYGTPISALINLYSKAYIKTVLKKQDSDMIMITGKSPIGPAFDGNQLTYMRNCDWIGMDMKKSVHITHARCSPRNDENYIYPGDEYELFYQDLTGWISLEKKRATNFYITFDNIPSGALYLLKNNSRGKEIRPFIYDENIGPIFL
ncbi:hypothetical protein KG007_08630 [Alistipes sp. kh20]|uniref:hypothetical protein n=1 Tax=Alistipes montrealensis TaxID=2834113 RepID=UPI001BD0DEBB|nr:hypothetical protein [Alistipes montrealensis]MBS4766272.1 hypothetical protein [Alistipes montrealensis]